MNKELPPEDSSEAAEIFRQANILYFRSNVYEQTTWMGRPALKCPMDMWVYQELMHGLETDLVIETGTFAGGSALYFAHVFDALGYGSVVSIDIRLQADLPQHPRIRYIEGSSISESVIQEVSAAAARAKSTLVVLDSDHKAPHKLRELMAYSDFVTPGSYIIAEDSGFDHYPSWPEFGSGPAAAVKAFLARDNRFEADRTREQHRITFAPAAFLKRHHT